MNKNLEILNDIFDRYHECIDEFEEEELDNEIRHAATDRLLMNLDISSISTKSNLFLISTKLAMFFYENLN